MPGVVEVPDQLVGVEVLVRVEDVLHQQAAAVGELLAADLQEFAELLDGRVGDGQGS